MESVEFGKMSAAANNKTADVKQTGSGAGVFQSSGSYAAAAAAGSGGKATAEHKAGGGGDVEIIVTGFGKFNGVETNPTEQLIKALPKLISDEYRLPVRNAPHRDATPHSHAALRSALIICFVFPHTHTAQKCLSVVSCSVLEVSRPGCNEAFPKLCHSSTCKTASPKRCVYVHFGVNGRADTILLEMVGYNDATFRCKDESGGQPNCEPIDPAKPLGHALASTLPVAQLRNELRDDGFAVELSVDPGRFLCNYI